MIISHKYKFIFFAIPKTGTHSVRFALRPFLDKNDEEHVNLFHKSKLKIPEIKERTDGHFSVQKIRPYIKDEVWNTYFKFAFVRNPFDRFVSGCFFKNPLVKNNPGKELPFMKLVAQKELKKRSFFFHSQLDYLTDLNGEIALDYIGKVENYQQDYEIICNKLLIPVVELEKRNASVHQHYSSYYDDELTGYVRELYEKDFLALKYPQTL